MILNAQVTNKTSIYNIPIMSGYFDMPTTTEILQVKLDLPAAEFGHHRRKMVPLKICRKINSAGRKSTGKINSAAAEYFFGQFTAVAQIAQYAIHNTQFQRSLPVANNRFRSSYWTITHNLSQTTRIVMVELVLVGWHSLALVVPYILTYYLILHVSLFPLHTGWVGQ